MSSRRSSGVVAAKVVTVVLVMKVPTFGRCKTRLSPGFGLEGALEVAQAMAIESLRRFFSETPKDWRKVVYYGPAESEAELHRLEKEAGVAWEHLAMVPHDLKSSDLGSLSTRALTLCGKRTRAPSFSWAPTRRICLYLSSSSRRRKP